MQGKIEGKETEEDLEECTSGTGGMDLTTTVRGTEDRGRWKEGVLR